MSAGKFKDLFQNAWDGLSKAINAREDALYEARYRQQVIRFLDEREAQVLRDLHGTEFVGDLYHDSRTDNAESRYHTTPGMIGERHTGGSGGIWDGIEREPTYRLPRRDSTNDKIRAGMTHSLTRQERAAFIATRKSYEAERDARLNSRRPPTTSTRPDEYRAG